MLSSVFKQECEYLMYSFNVMLEGKNVCRMGIRCGTTRRTFAGELEGCFMPELMEPVMLGLVEVGPDKCPICEKAPHPQRTTKDKKEKKGCLKSIPANLGCAALPSIPDVPNYATAAHHLIPANQCLKAFKRLSQMCEVVGYDVNNSANGLSLPTCGHRL